MSTAGQLTASTKLAHIWWRPFWQLRTRTFTITGGFISARSPERRLIISAAKRLKGGSTITQQYVKNAILEDRERSVTRKIREVILALELEQNFTKDEILTAYLNTISFGSIYDGITSASRGYFGKSPADLTIDEASILVAAIPAPSYYWSNQEAHQVPPAKRFAADAQPGAD